MPAKVKTQGRPDDPTAIHYDVPMWLKRRAVEAASQVGKNWTDFCKDALRDATDRVLGPRKPK